MSFLCGVYLLATEFVPAQQSKGEVVVFRRGQECVSKSTHDEEAQNPHGVIRVHPNAAE